MPEPPSVNSWLEDELYQQYLYDRQTVDPGWTEVFESNGTRRTLLSNGDPGVAASREARELHRAAKAHRAIAAAHPARTGPPARSRAAHRRKYDGESAIPVATSQRVMPVKVIDENRRTINQHRAATGQSKLSYTHLIAWAIVKALEEVPALNQAFSESGDESYRVTRDHVNLGIAVDVAGKDGARSLKVPSTSRTRSR